MHLFALLVDRGS